MMIETMAGKSAALHGICHDCTPFTFSEDIPAVDHFGKLLVKGRNSWYVCIIVLVNPALILNLLVVCIIAILKFCLYVILGVCFVPVPRRQDMIA